MPPQGREGREGPDIPDGEVEDPERLQIGAEIVDTPLTAAQLAELTGVPLTRVRRHLRQMREEGSIESVTRKGKRGTIEHFNLLRGAVLLEDDLAERSLAERRRHWANVLKIVLTDASRSLVTHPRERNLERLETVMTRNVFLTDEAGWKELAAMHREFYDRVGEARDRIARRLAEEDEEAFQVSSVLMLFESETKL